MNGISHKQAVQWIHRRLDGLLDEGQLSSLDEHLYSCEFCRTYAAELDSLPAELQSKFHARWDEESGPSRKVMEYVTARARRIHVSNRISSGAALLAGTVALTLLGIAINFVVSRLQSTSPTTNATVAVDVPLPQDRRLAFASDQSGSFDIYTMHADGSGLTNLTNNAAMDISPFWSPDGRRIAFESSRDGFGQIYSMDADGTDVIQLTKNEADHRFVNFVNDFSPWSPDGSKLIFSETLPEEDTWKLYVIDASGENKTALVDESNIYSAISWSPDGQHIALQADDPRNLGGLRLYIVNADGSGLRETTGSLQQNQQLSGSDYHWSPDGESIFFVAFFQKTDPYWTAYEFNLHDNSLIEHATTNTPLYGWWDGISLGSDLSGTSSLHWLLPDGTTNTLEPHKKCQQPGASESGSYIQRSSNGNWVIGAYCPNGDTWFYWVNSDGTVIKPLFNSPLYTLHNAHSLISWSRDDKFIAFTVSAGGESDMYVLNLSEALKDPSIPPVIISKSFGASWQPMGNESVVRETASPQLTLRASAQGLIAFSAVGENSELDIFTVRANSTELNNLTKHPAKDFGPTWSPDGRRIAFVSDRDGNENIYVMNADGSNLTQLTTEPVSETGPVWSPDGTKIAYISDDLSGQGVSIYAMDSNGQNHRPLNGYQYIPNLVWPAAWSPDSQFITFNYGSEIVQDMNDPNASSEMGRFFVKVGVYAAGFGDPTGAFTTYKQDMLGPFTLSQDGSKLFYLAECEQNSAEFCSIVKTIHENNPNPEIHETIRVDDICHVKQTPSWMGQSIKWSPDRTKVMFLLTCEEDGWIYIANADGSDFKPLTSYPILGNGPGNEVATADWSPDSQSIVFMSALGSLEREDLFMLNVNASIQNPDLLPSPLNISASQISSPAWQPVHR